MLACMLSQHHDAIQSVLANLREHLQSPAFAALARHRDHPRAFTRSRKLPLPKLVACLCGFRGGSVQSELDSFFAHMGTGLDVLRSISDRALAKARAKLHVPALWALNAHLIRQMQLQGLLPLWKGRRLVCADATVLAPAQRACHRTRHLAAPSQRALGLYLPTNEVMLHVSVGPESEGERQMLFDQLDLLQPGDVLVLDRGYPATWLVQLLHQRGIDFIIRCDSTRGWAAAQKLLRSGSEECWAYLGATHADKVATWELDGPAQMHIRLVRHVSSSGSIRVMVTSLDQRMATVAELADLYHGRWRIEEAFKRLKHRLGLESVSGLSQHALLVDVATKVLADNLVTLLNQAVLLPDAVEADPMPLQDADTDAKTGAESLCAKKIPRTKVTHKVNRALAAKTLSRCVGRLLLHIDSLPVLIHQWAFAMRRSLIRHIQGRSQPRNNTRHKPHPSQAYKRAA